MPGGVYTGGGATVVMDPSPVIYVKVMGVGSGVDRHIKRQAGQVAFRARALAPVGRTGRLKQGIRASQSRDRLGRYSFGYKVTSNAPYSLFVHEGTRPRVIKSFPGKMAFEGTHMYAGQLIVTPIVHHPGNAANPFLQKALSAMVM